GGRDRHGYRLRWAIGGRVAPRPCAIAVVCYRANRGRQGNWVIVGIAERAGVGCILAFIDRHTSLICAHNRRLVKRGTSESDNIQNWRLRRVSSRQGSLILDVLSGQIKRRTRRGDIG